MTDLADVKSWCELKVFHPQFSKRQAKEIVKARSPKYRLGGSAGRKRKKHGRQ